MTSTTRRPERGALPRASSNDTIVAVEFQSDEEAADVRGELEASALRVETGYGYATSLAGGRSASARTLNVTLSPEAARMLGCRLQALGFSVDLGAIDGKPIAFFYRP
ncbi:hypothetical protein [Anaeromyxobacter oryzisoli]|uniref:hypothetical protein n=1 Tax=Anaeromyxobacter oryzisoli TaxID=2925408 RepID=UPI001F5888C9|nr:hypothetical protein [Anaeromyxobacter sp. SG63]